VSAKADRPCTEAKLLSLVARSGGQDFTALIEWNATISAAQAEIDEARARCASELRELKAREATLDAERARLDCALAAATRLQEVEAERDQLRSTLDEVTTAQRVAISARRGRGELKLIN